MSRTILIGLMAACVSPVLSIADAARPNIVLLLADDLGYGELGCQGNAEIPTPNIDSLARSGVRFTSGYVTGPFCSSSRAGLLTGRYQTRFGYEKNPIGAQNADPNIGLPATERTLARHVHDAGYATGLVGKWHLGGTAAYHPLRRGFDEFYGFLHEGHYFLPPPYRGATTMLRRRTLPNGQRDRWIDPDGRLILSTHMNSNEPAYDADNPILRGGQPVEESAYLTDALTREAVDFIERHRERPFFLCVAYNAVHSPLQGLNTDMERFAHIEDVHRRIFAAMLHRLDLSVGTILASLHDWGLDDNTLVVFLSDNGGPTRELTSSNAPLRGEKGDLYEGGIRVPFLMRWPGRIPAGLVYESPVISLDLFPTAAALAGHPLPAAADSDGVDLLPFLRGENTAPPHDSLYWRSGEKAALRRGDWKIVRNPSGRREADWELYHLAADASEQHNRRSAEPARFAELLAAWEKLNAEMRAPLW